MKSGSSTSSGRGLSRKALRQTSNASGSYELLGLIVGKRAHCRASHCQKALLKFFDLPKGDGAGGPDAALS